MKIHSKRAGSTLLELLGLIVVLAVVINLGATMFVSATRLNAVGMKRMTSIADERELADGVRNTIRDAMSVVPALGEYRTGADCLILEMPEGDEGTWYAVLRRFGDEPRLGRLALRDTGEGLEAVKAKDYPPAVAEYRFAWDSVQASDARLVSFFVRYEGEEEGSPWQAIHTALRGRSGGVQ
jgi:hypothetical protein